MAFHLITGKLSLRSYCYDSSDIKIQQVSQISPRIVEIDSDGEMEN